MKWLKGRQGTGYDKLPLINLPRFDTWIVRYREGDYIPEHVDEHSDGDIIRINVELWKAFEGGVFSVDGKCFSLLNRLFMFNASKCRHSVSEVVRGTRIVLSIGYLKRK